MVDDRLFLYTMVSYAKFHVMHPSNQLFEGARSYPLENIQKTPMHSLYAHFYH